MEVNGGREVVVREGGGCTHDNACRSLPTIDLAFRQSRDGAYRLRRPACVSYKEQHFSELRVNVQIESQRFGIARGFYLLRMRSYKPYIWV